MPKKAPKTPEKLLQEALNIFWNELNKKKKGLSSERAKKYLLDAENELKYAEDLLRAKQIAVAGEIAKRAGTRIKGVGLRCAIENFRKANELQLSVKGLDRKKKTFLQKASKTLGRAERLLDDNKLEEARAVLNEYFHQKITVFGLPISMF